MPSDNRSGLSLARSRGADVRLRIIGPSLLPKEREHRTELEDLVRRLCLEPVVTVEPGVPYETMPSLMRQATAVAEHGERRECGQDDSRPPVWSGLC